MRPEKPVNPETGGREDKGKGNRGQEKPEKKDEERKPPRY
jgi:hypothetical protein